MKRNHMPRILGLIGSLSAMGLANLSVLADAQYIPYNGTTSKPTTKGALPKGAIQSVPLLQEKGLLTVTGDENWDEITSFGKESTMAEMMILMMVGGSGMEHMKMGAMKPGMKMANMTLPEMEMSAKGLAVTVTLNSNPPVVGDNILDVLVTDSSGKPMAGLKLSATVAMTSMDMGTTRPKVAEGKDGHYTTVINFSMKGPWRVVLMNDAKSDKAKTVRSTLDFNVDGKTKWVQPMKAGLENTWKVVLNTKLDTLKVGTNMLDITVLDPMGTPVSGAIVTSAVEMTSMDMGVTKPKTKEGKDGHYLTEVQFSMKGPWRVKLTIAPPKQKPFVKSLDFKVAQ